MSLGGKRTPSADSEPCPQDEQTAVFHALAKGAVVLASVGNTGPKANTVEEPGVCLGVVSVGAVDSAGRVASFSGRQPYLTLVAPGVHVPVARPDRRPGVLRRRDEPGHRDRIRRGGARVVETSGAVRTRGGHAPARHAARLAPHARHRLRVRRAGHQPGGDRRRAHVRSRTRSTTWRRRSWRTPRPSAAPGSAPRRDRPAPRGRPAPCPSARRPGGRRPGCSAGSRRSLRACSCCSRCSGQPCATGAAAEATRTRCRTILRRRRASSRTTVATSRS